MDSNLKILPARKHNSIVTMGFSVSFKESVADFDLLFESISKNSDFLFTMFSFVTRENSNEEASIVLSSQESVEDSDWVLVIEDSVVGLYHKDYRRWAYSFAVIKSVFTDLLSVFSDREIGSLFVGYLDGFHITVRADGKPEEDGVIPAILFKESKFIPSIFFENNMASFETKFIGDIISNDYFSFIENFTIEAGVRDNFLVGDNAIFDVFLDTQVDCVCSASGVLYSRIFGVDDGSFDELALLIHNSAKNIFVSVIADKVLSSVGIDVEGGENAA